MKRFALLVLTVLILPLLANCTATMGITTGNGIAAQCATVQADVGKAQADFALAKGLAATLCASNLLHPAQCTLIAAQEANVTRLLTAVQTAAQACSSAGNVGAFQQALAAFAAGLASYNGLTTPAPPPH